MSRDRRPVHMLQPARLFASMLFAAGLLVASAHGAYAETAGDFEVTGGEQGVDWNYGNHVLAIDTGAKITVAMAAGKASTTSDDIAIAQGASANVTLDSVNIDEGYNGCPLDVSGATLHLKLQGSNVFRAGSFKSGLHVPKGAGLTISGTGSLDVTGTDFCAAIGAGNTTSYGSITVASGTVNAVGHSFGAGIGGSRQGDGTITITGGKVTASGGDFAAGIGGGSGNDGGRVFITGGEVLARGGSEGAGIGGGSEGGNFAVEISGAVVTANGGADAAGVGGGTHAQNITVSITGGTITAVGGKNGAGVGAGYIPNVFGVGIDGGAVTATGGAGSAAIGRARADSSGSVKISAGSILATPGAGESAALVADAISITGGIYGKGTVSASPLSDRGKAYEQSPDEGYISLDNDEVPSSKTYPVRVYRLQPFDLSVAQIKGDVYTGNPFDTGALGLSGAGALVPDSAKMASAASYRYRRGDEAWTKGLPTAAGTYRLEITEDMIRDDRGNIAFCAAGTAETDIVIARKPIKVISAAVESKTFDGGRAAVVGAVTFEGLVGEEKLARSRDYTVSAAFRTAEAGADRTADVTIALIEDGPTAHNYICKNDDAHVTARAEIRPAGGKSGARAAATGSGSPRGGGLPVLSDVFISTAGPIASVVLAAGSIGVGVRVRKRS